MNPMETFALFTREPQFNYYFNQITEEAIQAKKQIDLYSLFVEIDPSVKERVESLHLFVSWWKKRQENWNDFAIAEHYFLSEEVFSRLIAIGVELFVDRIAYLKRSGCLSHRNSFPVAF